MSVATDIRVRDQLKAVRDQLAESRRDRVVAKKERDDAKEAFGKADFSADGDVKITESKPFKDAEQAVKALGEVDDRIYELQDAERGMLKMLGDAEDRSSPTANGGGNRSLEQTFGWDGHRLLAVSDEFRNARERGIFDSSARFGTVTIGEVASREEFLAAALPAAPAGIIGTDQGAVRPDFRGIIGPYTGPLTILDLIPTGTTDSNIIQYVQVTAIPGSAAETAELSLKPQEGLTLLDATAPVRTIAGWAKLARQAMDDMAGLATLINTLLPYDVRRRLQAQILAGDGLGQNLTGLLNTTGVAAPASAAGDNVADGILRAVTTVVLSDADPNFVAMNPITWQNLLMMKTGGSGQYIYGSPGELQTPVIWGLRIVANRFVPQASPLVGDANGCSLLVREGVNVKTSDSDQDDFIRNRVTVLAETRVAFPIWRPSAFARAPIG